MATIPAIPEGIDPRPERRPTQELEGVILCSATAGVCKCSKEHGHAADGDKVHECDPAQCTGAWSGDYEKADFRIVRMPWPVR